MGFKTVNEINQNRKLFLPLPGLLSKIFFYNILSVLTQEFKISFQNRKWNYPNKTWNYFSHFLASDQKTYFHFFQEFKIDFRQEIELYEQEMELFFQFQASDRNIHFTKIFHFHQGVHLYLDIS